MFLGKCVRDGDRAGTREHGFPKTALIIGGTSDFVPRWQMVGWGGIQRGEIYIHCPGAQTPHRDNGLGEGRGTKDGEEKKNFPFQHQTNGSGN